jgi:trans-2,3-dihydro-3-hydroxyanthranilate isomerase
VDAFTTIPLEGNPCAVVLDAGDLSDREMQAVAREMNLAETAFVLPPRTTDLRARYFTPVEEIPLAGHPTLATLAALVEAGRLEVGSEPRILTLELPAGVVTVEGCRESGGHVRITMTQRPPELGPELDPEEVLPVFGLDPADALSGALPQVVSTGTPQLMVPLVGLDALRRAQLRPGPLRALLEATGTFGPHLFCLEGFTPKGSTAARHFGLPPDLPEDPFTGSATGGMAAYLWHHHLVERPQLVAEQGHLLGRPGRAWVEVVGSPEAMETVRVGGHAVAVLRGTPRI